MIYTSELSYLFTVSRLGLTFLIQQHLVNATVAHLAALLIMAGSMTAWGFWTTPLGMSFCSFLFGFAMASCAPVHSEVVLLVVGQELYSFALGCSWMFMAMGWMLGGPAAGRLPW